MNSSKMSLDAFKALAENQNVEIALESILGGKNLLDECHDNPTEVKGIVIDPDKYIWKPR